ncbi:MAG: DedA family protein [Gaiellales bacterium]
MSTVLDWFSRYGYLAVFFPVMLELVGIPFPSETILLAAGATASLSRLNLLAVMALGLAAAVIGALLGYLIGHAVGKRLLGWTVRRGFLRQHHLDRVDGFFSRHGGKTLVLARFLPGVRIPTFWMAGAGSMPVRRFMAWNVVGATLWVVTVTLAGYVFAGSVGALDQVLGRDAAIAMAAVVVLGAVAFEIRRRLREQAVRSGG